MRLDYALLANAAESASRNRIHILGANISTWESMTFPVDAAFAVVAKLHFSQEEFNRRYQYRIELGLPNGDYWQRLTEDYEFTTAENQARPEIGSSMTIMAHVNVRLPESGDYKIRLIIDGDEAACLPLYAMRLEDPAKAQV